MLILRSFQSAAAQTYAKLRTVRARHVTLAASAAVIIVAGTSAADSGNGRQQALIPTHVRQWLQVGEASWYGLKFQGHKTATGERFDMHSLTCAHRSVPLGSWLRVTNLRNHKSVLVRVNDRGPMAEDRIVDLSYAAAQAVGLNGTGKVKLERISAADPQIARELVAQVPEPSGLLPGMSRLANVTYLPRR